MREQSLFITLAVFMLIALPGGSYASPLESLLHSDQVQKIEKYNRAHDRKIKFRKASNKHWVDLDTNYGKLFYRKVNIPKLIEWLRSSSGRFIYGNTHTTKVKEYISATAKISDGKQKKPIYLEVFVPHPKYAEMIRYNIVKKFRDLTPKKTQIVLQEEVQIGRSFGTIYKLEDGRCKMLIKCERQSIIQLVRHDCSKISIVEDAARTLDLMRFNHKLKT